MSDGRQSARSSLLKFGIFRASTATAARAANQPAASLANAETTSGGA
jgi:hypothetical protein